jgi:hypothetical protein
MADNRNAGWRGRHGWGEKSGETSAFGEERWSDPSFDRDDATGYNPAGRAQGGYGAGYDRYRADSRHRGEDRDRGYGVSRNYGAEWADDRGSRDAGGGRYGEGRSYDEGPYTPYGRRAESGHDHTRGRPAEGRSFVGHNEYIEAVTDGETGAGEHRGRGPKGYRRSDERIREDVSDRLTDDSWLDASNIEVSVDDGEVTLSGSVDSRDAKRRAEDLAERVSGVGDVQNQLKVRRGPEINDQTRASTTI